MADRGGTSSTQIAGGMFLGCLAIVVGIPVALLLVFALLSAFGGGW